MIFDFDRPKRKSQNGTCLTSFFWSLRKLKRRVRLLYSRQERKYGITHGKPHVLKLYRPAQITAPGFTPVGNSQGALVPMGGADPSSSASQPNGANGVDLSVGAHTGALPLAPTSILPARPNLPDDPVIPHNGFTTVEEGEKAFMHLLRKAGVDANWTWDQTMRAIITDPLYKALNTLAEKKAAWEKVITVSDSNYCG